MSEFVIHGLDGSPFMRAVEIVLQEKGADYHVEKVTAPESKQPAYLARQPFGKIPAFSHGDFHLYETQAICRYLDTILPEPALQPTDPKKAARMNQVIGIVDCYYFPLVARNIVFNRIVAPMLGFPVNEEAITAGYAHAVTCMGELDNLLGDNEFMAGDQYTLADVMLAPQLSEFLHTPEGASLIGASANLGSWLERMKERPTMKSTLRRF